MMESRLLPADGPDGTLSSAGGMQAAQAWSRTLRVHVVDREAAAPEQHDRL